MNIEEVKILVTGGAGFIGSEIVRQLVDLNTHVTILDNFSSGKWEYVERFRNVKICVGDICDRERVSEALVDQEYVINLAALPFIPDSYQFPQDFFLVNTVGSVNILSQSIESKTIKKFVQVSTSEVYGTAKYVPMDESHPLNPHSTYAVSKLAADRAVFTMHKEHSFPAVIIRPFNSYGPNITQPYIIPEIILQLLNGSNNLILGNIESSRDFTYVADTARGILMALFKNQSVGHTINIGSGSEKTIRDLAYLIARLMGKRISISRDESRLRPFDVQRLCCSNCKAEKLLGWRPHITIEEGLRRTIKWVKMNGIHFNSPFKGWPKQYRTLTNITEMDHRGILVQ